MKKLLKGISRTFGLRIVVAMLAVCMGGAVLKAEIWRATAGAEGGNLGSQAFGFLPNELWIHAGDGIQWAFGSSDEMIHTVTFLGAGQVRPPLLDAAHNFIGCPGVSPDPSSFTGLNCVTSARSGIGHSFTVYFPVPGNFKLTCLVHADMTGSIHVVEPSSALPHDQSFYDRAADHQRSVLIAEVSGLSGQANSEPDGSISAGVSAIISTGAGSQTASLLRFLRENIVVRVGDSVEWVNRDASIPHTVTFGTEPEDPRPPSANVTLDLDGARHATIGAPTDSVNSGILTPTPQDRPGLAQAPLAITRFRVTFTRPGVFNYICSLHDVLGMKGTVIVHR